MNLVQLIQGASKSGWSTSEAWVTMLSKPITAIVTFLVAFLVAHHVIDQWQAQAIIGAVVPAVATYAAGEAAKAYSMSRAAVKAEVLRLAAAHPDITRVLQAGVSTPTPPQQ